jgi:hypothetical protein
MREDRTALRGGKAYQINDDGVEPLLQQVLGNLPQKGWDVEPSRRDRTHRIIGPPLPINPIACPCRITPQGPHTVFQPQGGALFERTIALGGRVDAELSTPSLLVTGLSHNVPGARDPSIQPARCTGASNPPAARAVPTTPT